MYCSLMFCSYTLENFLFRCLVVSRLSTQKIILIVTIEYYDELEIMVILMHLHTDTKLYKLVH